MVEELAEEAQAKAGAKVDRAEDPRVLAALRNASVLTVAMKSPTKEGPHVRKRSVPNAELD